MCFWSNLCVWKNPYAFFIAVYAYVGKLLHMDRKFSWMYAFEGFI